MIVLQVASNMFLSYSKIKLMQSSTRKGAIYCLKLFFYLQLLQAILKVERLKILGV